MKNLKVTNEKNDTKCIKNEKKVVKRKRNLTKKSKKRTKFNKVLFWAIVIEYVICAIVVLVCSAISIEKENEKLKLVIISQQETIEALAKATESRNVNEIVAETIEYINTPKEETKYKYNLSMEDRELLAKLLYHEGRGESLDCQKAIVSVIINRLNSGKWGNTLHDVIYARNQFEPVGKGLIDGTKPLAKQYEAIDYVLENGVTVPEDVIYFRASYYFSWATPYMSMDNTYFSF